MNARSRLLTLLLTAALTLTCLPAGAERGGHDRGGSDNEGISEQEAASIVKRAYDGRVMSVKREGNRFKVTVLLEGGRIKTVSVDSHGNLSD